MPMAQKRDYSLTELLDLEKGQPAYAEQLVVSSPQQYGKLLLAFRERAGQALGQKVPAWGSSVKCEFDTAVHELGVNAAKYGNHYQPGSKVDCLIYSKNNLIGIVVGDQGDGFTDEDLKRIYLSQQEPEETPSQVLQRINTSQFEISGELGLDSFLLDSSGIGFYLIRRLNTFAGLYITVGSNEVRVYLDAAQAAEDEE